MTFVTNLNWWETEPVGYLRSVAWIENGATVKQIKWPGVGLEPVASEVRRPNH